TKSSARKYELTLGMKKAVAQSNKKAANTSRKSKGQSPKLGIGLWTLDFGLWTLDFGLWTLDILKPGVWGRVEPIAVAGESWPAWVESGVNTDYRVLAGYALGGHG